MIRLIKKILSKKEPKALVPKSSIPKEAVFSHTSFVPIVADDSYSNPPTSAHLDFSGGFSSGSHSDSGSHSHFDSGYSDGGSSSDGGSCGCDGGGGGGGCD